MYKFTRSTRFERDVKQCIKKRRNMNKFVTVHNLLIRGETLPNKYKNHSLGGNWKGYRELHFERDWLLIYRVDEKAKIIEYIRMGTHDKLLK